MSCCHRRCRRRLTPCKETFFSSSLMRLHVFYVFIQTPMIPHLNTCCLYYSLNDNFIIMQRIIIAILLLINLIQLSLLIIHVSSARGAQQQEHDNDGHEQRLGAQLANLAYFKVSSRAMFIGKASNLVDTEVRLLEQYSNEQQRARLEFKFRKDEPNGDTKRKTGAISDSLLHGQQVKYIFSGASDKLMRTMRAATAGGLKCELSNRAALASDMFGLDTRTRDGVSSAPELASWESLLWGPRMPRHIVGFARLLMFVELNWAHFERVSQAGGATVRNSEIEKYSYSFQLDSPDEVTAYGSADAKVTLMAYLAKQATTSTGAGGGAYPFRVWLQLPSRAELIVDFSSVGALQPLGFDSTDLMSQFNFPLGHGCSAFLKDKSPPVSGVNREGKASTRGSQLQKVFSFEAELNELWFRESAGPLGHLFVAYDAYARALRVDTIKPTTTTTTTTIHDLALGVKYHHLAENSGLEHGKDNSYDDDEEIVRVSGARGPQCFVTRISKEEASQYNDDDDDEHRVLPWSSLVEMGSALVRGIEVQVYEMVSEQLPKFIFQQVSYVDSSGIKRLVFGGPKKRWPTKGANSSTSSNTKTNNNNNNENSFSIVYFITAQAASTADAKTTKTTTGGSDSERDKSAVPNQDQLIRVDIYQRDVLLYRADVHNFQWHLTSAPNGQPQDELFSLGDDNCAAAAAGAAHQQSEQPARAPARMQLELSLDWNDLRTNRLDLSAQDVVRLLMSAPARHEALTRSLAAYPSNSIFASQVRDVQSKLQVDQDLSSIKLAVDLQLASLPRMKGNALKAVAIGSALPLGAAAANTKEASTFEQCFWLAAREYWAQMLQNGSSVISSKDDQAVLFAFCGFKCSIDSQVTIDRRAAQTMDFSGGGGGPGGVVYHSRVFASVAPSGQLPCELLRMQLDDDDDDDEKDVQSERELIRPWRDVQQILRGKILDLLFISQHQLDDKTIRQNKLLFKVDKISLTSPAAGDDALEAIDNQIDTDHGIIDGLALSFELSESVTTLTAEDVDDQALEMCRARCVANLTCRSYSVCHVAHRQVECSISEIDLTNSFDSRRRLLSELGEKLDNFYKLDRGLAERRAGTISIQRKDRGDKEPKVISFRVNKRCQLRAMSTVSEMFSKVKLNVVSEGRYELARLLPVAGPNECAGLCLARNVMLLKHQTKGPGVLDLNETTASAKVASPAWCTSFEFLDTKLLDLPPYQALIKLRKIWHAAGLETERSTPGTGLCYLVGPTPAAASREDLGEKGTTAELDDGELVKFPKMDTYDFRFSLLYKRQAGFRLSTSSTSNDSSSLSQAIESSPPDIELCARNCFSRQPATNYLPTCRSFDVITFASGSLSCIYNSISLADVVTEPKSDAQERGSLTEAHPQQLRVASQSISMRYDHYEPQEAYALEVHNDAQVALGAKVAPQKVQEIGSSKIESSSSHAAGWNLTLVCVLLGLCTGSALALSSMNSHKHKRRKNQSSHHQFSGLINLPRLSRGELIQMEG